MLKILGHSYLVLKILGHSYLEQNNTGAQLFSTKNTGARYLVPKILGHSYLEQNNTGAQESGDDICMTLTRQTFARHTPLAKEQAKEHSLALLTHLTYYLCGKLKMNNSYYF